MGGARTARNLNLALPLVVAATLCLLLPGSAAAETRVIPPPVLKGVPGLPGPIAAPAQPAPQGLSLLRTTPDNGAVGSSFTLSGEGLPRNKSVDIVWATGKGAYVLNPTQYDVEFVGRQLEPVNVVLAKGTTDAAGRLSLQLKVPRDYGSIHDIYAVADGRQVAKGGFLVNRAYTVTPKKGPIGTPITITVTGLGWKSYESTVALIWDNRFAGYISSTTTRGAATVRIRAAGPVGEHTIEMVNAGSALPYLDIEQAGLFFVGRYKTNFTVTGDKGPPKPSMEWPEAVKPTVATRTTLLGVTTTGVTARLSSQIGDVLSKVDVTASGLAPGVPVDLKWATPVGTRSLASGWSMASDPLGRATPAADGSLRTSIEIPNNLGGWHTVQLYQNGKLQAEVSYYVRQKLLGVTPTTVKAGEMFTIRVRGVGWTELDNGFAVTYDNAYAGFACGFYEKGDVKLNLYATGGPGTHLIDFYPMIYKGKSTDLWNQQLPMLSFKQDNPGLALGYKLPAMRIAIRVVK